MLFAPGWTCATDYIAKLTQYVHVGWRVKDGDLGGAANSVTQTRDGYVWVGTTAGLERYDGVHFRHWKLPTESPVWDVLASRDGSLWASQGGIVNHLHGGVTDALVDDSGRYNGLYEDRAGGIWAARSRSSDGRGGLCQVGRPPFRCFGPADGQPCIYGQVVTQDANGELWVGGDKGACRWRPGQKSAAAPAPDAMRSLPAVVAFSPESDGDMLAGFEQNGPHLGLQKITASGVRPFIAVDLNGETLAVRSLLRDRDGTLWIGTSNGLYHIVDGRADHFGAADGLSSNDVGGLYEDREGEIWAATTGGVDKFRRQPMTAVTTREGLNADQISSVLSRRDGSVWIGTLDGLNVLRNGATRHIDTSEGLPGHEVTSLLEDHVGRIWVGVDNDLTWFDGKRFHLVRKPDGARLGVMMSLAEDSRGDIWAMVAGTHYTIYRIRRGQLLDNIQLPGGVYGVSLAGARDGAVWVADRAVDLFVYRDGQPTKIMGPSRPARVRQLTILPNSEALASSDGGLLFWSGGRWTVLDESRGLPCRRVGSSILDAKGFVWVRGQCGTFVIARSALVRLADDPHSKATFMMLDGADGAQPGFTTFHPDATASPDGRLWFATDGPLLTVDPDNLSSNTLPPPVHVEQILADHRAYAPGRNVQFPPLTRDVEIDYAGLSLLAPQKMRFRYKLSGVDRDWQDVETRRAAFYMNLKPGRYVFHVIASNNDGVWNLGGDIVGFTVKPAFYQTLWFQALVAVLLLTLAAFAVRLRLRAATAEIETRLSARQAERIRIARELHDTLLQGFQGLLVRFQVVADAIPAGEPTKPMMEAVLDRADEILVEGRDRVRDLRCEEDGGSPLSKALEAVAFALEREGCPPIEVRSSGAPHVLDPSIQHEFVAIAREALVNACKHARANAILCQLTFTPWRIALVVEDDGVGIDESIIRAGGRPGHWGLTGMRERGHQIGARLRVGRMPQGTRVELSLNTRLDHLRRLVRRMTLVGAP